MEVSGGVIVSAKGLVLTGGMFLVILVKPCMGFIMRFFTNYCCKCEGFFFLNVYLLCLVTYMEEYCVCRFATKSEPQYSHCIPYCVSPNSPMPLFRKKITNCLNNVRFLRCPANDNVFIEYFTVLSMWEYWEVQCGRHWLIQSYLNRNNASTKIGYLC